jgi:hypothetical protein
MQESDDVVAFVLGLKENIVEAKINAAKRALF